LLRCTDRCSMCSRERLPGVLRDSRFDWVTITSPEAATVFREGWLAADRPPVQIAAVGAGTGKALSSMEASGALDPAFVPTMVLPWQCSSLESSHNQHCKR